MYEELSNILFDRYIYSEKIARVLILAIKSEKNVLLWGPGGHGKSEMVQVALSVIAEQDDIFVQSFGEGMDEATLWGGTSEKENVLRYCPENSFLQKPFAIFEELFDAPTSVLLPLKNTLTARQLCKGSQVFVMKTRVVVAITNKDPRDISNLGLTEAALVERFPLQLKVDWSSYGSADYLRLFQKVSQIQEDADLERILAEIMAKASESRIISPRTAVHAFGLVKTAARLRKSELVKKEDFFDLRYLLGMDLTEEDLARELDVAYERLAAETRV